MNFTQQNFFQLFGLPERFAIDQTHLQAAYHLIQEQVHPDRHVNASEATRRLAQQWATYVNEAYQTLTQASARARYLCGLRGEKIDNEAHTAMPVDFLEQQMAWREALADGVAHDKPRLLALLQEVQTTQAATLARLEKELDEHNATTQALLTVRKLMFIEKFSSELEDKLEVFKN